MSERSWRQRLRAWARNLRADTAALCLAARDPRVPLPARVLAWAVAAYALSPVDLIPDFIPVLGYLDDLVLVPLGIALVIRVIPAPLWAQLRAEADGRSIGASAFGLALVGAIWALGMAAMWNWWRGRG